MRELFKKNGIFSRHIDGFSIREPQILMAEKVEEVILESSSAVIEAPTGVGKTIAYLVPVLKNKKKAIISTATIVLQHQLFEKDIPLVSEALNVKVRVELLKGRQNYLCLLRYFNEKNRVKGKKEDDFFSILSSWLEYTEKGDFAEIEGISLSDVIVKRINADKNYCTGKKCPHYSTCFFYRARKRCQDADIILVNHHLLLADLAVKNTDFGNILPPVDVLIVDEAHKFESIASYQFGDSISKNMVSIFFNQLPSELKLKYVSQFDVIIEEADRCIDRKKSVCKLDNRHSLFISLIRETFTKIKQDLLLLKNDEFEMRDSLLKRAERFVSFAELVHHEDFVSFYQVEGNNTVFRLVPLDVSRNLAELLNLYYPCSVFTSATLSVNNDLSFFKKSVGLEHSEGVIIPPVFNYRENTILYIPRDIPSVDHPEFVKFSLMDILPLLKQLGGRTFLLCTSLKNVNAFASLLKKSGEFNVFVQGDESPSLLVDNFRESENAILVGSFSFWEGIDVRGQDLLCIVIDRLPFNRPDDPIFSEKAARIKNAFKEYAIPLAVLQLKQGLGRLIRDESDRGVFVILDKRLKERWYGRNFLKSLFEVEIVRERDRVVDFIHKKVIKG